MFNAPSKAGALGALAAAPPQPDPVTHNQETQSSLGAG